MRFLLLDKQVRCENRNGRQTDGQERRGEEKEEIEKGEMSKLVHWK